MFTGDLGDHSIGLLISGHGAGIDYNRFAFPQPGITVSVYGGLPTGDDAAMTSRQVVYKQTSQDADMLI
jgi:hypothetical protein